MNDRFIDVYTGKVIVSSKPVILRAMAIGSCIAVMVYDRHRKIGGIAHIMLPGRSPSENSEDRTKYAEDAIDILLDAVKKHDTGKEDLEINIVGAADMLGEGGISKEIAGSVLGYLEKLGVGPKNKKIGGIERRSVSLDIETGRIFYSEGDSMVKEL